MDQPGPGERPNRGDFAPLVPIEPPDLLGLFSQLAVVLRVCLGMVRSRGGRRRLLAFTPTRCVLDSFPSVGGGGIGRFTSRGDVRLGPVTTARVPACRYSADPKAA